MGEQRTTTGSKGVSEEEPLKDAKVIEEQRAERFRRRENYRNRRQLYRVKNSALNDYEEEERTIEIIGNYLMMNKALNDYEEEAE